MMLDSPVYPFDELLIKSIAPPEGLEVDWDDRRPNCPESEEEMHDRFVAGMTEHLNENQITILVTHFYGIYEICNHFDHIAGYDGFCSLIHAVNDGENWEVKLSGSCQHLIGLVKE